MRFGKSTHWAIVASALFITACSSGTATTQVVGSPSAVVQDLSLDPNGLTTVVALPSSPGVTLTPGNFETDGTQIALSATLSGNQATVVWDDRVTSNDQVRVVGVSGVGADFTAVTSSDMSSPTFSLTLGTQTPGLGGDSFEAHFSGPRLVETEAEDPANWILIQDGNVYDLVGSTIDYDPVTGVTQLTMGVDSSLHASYSITAAGIHSVADVPVSSGSISGAAVGDSTAPSLVLAEQQLGEDEYGRVVDFTFDEAMDPVSSKYLANFFAGLPVFATSVIQPTSGVLRVTFTEPMIPGVDSVTLQNLTDSHGNAYAGAVVPVAQGSSVANGFDGSPELRSVENSDNDLIVAVFDQALDPEDAVDAAHWTLEVDSTPVSLAGADFTYDFLGKTLSVDLGADFANGAAFDLGPAIGAEPLDVDGDLFTETFTGTVSGDAMKPRVITATQNRSVAIDGTIVDVLFSEDVDAVTAENPANWSAPGGQAILNMTRMADLRTVRIEFNALMLPGDSTISLEAVEDIAGNVMLPTVHVALLSTDSIAPGPTLPIADAVEGANNDTLTVDFTDDMLEAEVEVPLSWTVEAPIGVSLDTSLAVVDYDPASRQATLVFSGGGDMPSRGSFTVALANMQDIGGNQVSGVQVGGIVGGDINYPIAESAWVDGLDDTIVHLRMSEPCSGFSDYYDPILNPLALTRYELRDVLGASAGVPTSVGVSADSLQVELTFGTSVVAGSHTLDLRGILDLAGNQLFPIQDLPIFTEDPVAPALELSVSSGLAFTGEENDQMTVVFDREMSAWGLMDLDHYALTLGGSPVDLTRASLSFDGSRSVTIDFDGLGADNLQTSGSYSLSVTGVTSRWGVDMSGASADTIVVGGDNIVPTLDAGKLRLDASDPTTSVLVEMSEALNADDGSDETAIDIGAVNPVLAVHVGPRTSRATFGSVSVGETVNVSMRDLAGNLGFSSQLIVSQDTSGPSVSSVSGVITPGAGGDELVIRFDRPVQSGLALDWHHYTAEQGGTAIDLSTATPRYDSTQDAVRFLLPEGVNLEDGTQVHVTASGVTGLGGLPIVAADLLGDVAGDSTAPTLTGAFVNYYADVQGYEVEVMFDEAIEPLQALYPVSWSSSAGQTPVAVSQQDGRVFRVRFASPLTGGEQLTITTVPDLAGNVSGSLVVDVSP